MKKPYLILYFLYMAIIIGLRMATFWFPLMDTLWASLGFTLLCIPGLMFSVRNARYYKTISLNKQWMFILLSWLYGFWMIASILSVLMSAMHRFLINR